MEECDDPAGARRILEQIGLEHGIDYPFQPLMKLPADAPNRYAPYRWRWWCPRLGKDGRCTDYENRPPLCRTFQAGDAVCAYPDDENNATAVYRIREMMAGLS